MARHAAKLDTVAGLRALDDAVPAGSRRKAAGVGSRPGDDVGLHAIGHTEGGHAAGVRDGSGAAKSHGDVGVATAHAMAVGHDGTLATAEIGGDAGAAGEPSRVATGAGARAVINGISNAVDTTVLMGMR